MLGSIEDEVSLSATDETDELSASDVVDVINFESVTPLDIVEPLPSEPDPSYVETGYFIKK